jgi:hypothetical protein
MTAKRTDSEPSSEKARSLSVRERKPVRGVASGLPVNRAARLAGYTPATAQSRAYDVMRKPAVQSALRRAMEAVGISDELIATRLKEALNATKTVRVTHKGVVTRTFRDPDATERREAAKLVTQLRGDLAPERPGDQTLQIAFISNVSIEPFRQARAKALAAMAAQEAEALPEAPEPLNPEDHP